MSRDTGQQAVAMVAGVTAVWVAIFAACTMLTNLDSTSAGGANQEEGTTATPGSPQPQHNLQNMTTSRNTVLPVVGTIGLIVGLAMLRRAGNELTSAQFWNAVVSGMLFVAGAAIEIATLEGTVTLAHASRSAAAFATMTGGIVSTALTWCLGIWLFNRSLRNGRNATEVTAHLTENQGDPNRGGVPDINTGTPQPTATSPVPQQSYGATL